MEEIGLAQSTYYGWSRKYKEEGLEGLLGGSPVPDETWNRFDGLARKQSGPVESDTKGKTKEKAVMGNSGGDDKRKEILFRRFDDGSTKTGAAQGGNLGGGGETTPQGPSACEPFSDEPMDKTVKYAMGAFIFVVAILLAASFSNSSNFYFKTNKQMVELWKGRFAPMGEVKVATFSDPKIVEGLPAQDSYNKAQAYGVLFDYLIDEADQVLDTERTPDLKAVKSYLAHAGKYAVSSEDRAAIRMRLSSIDFLVLCGKADLALTKGTLADFQAAKKYLNEALSLAPTDVREGVVEKRLAAVNYALNVAKKGESDKSLIELYREKLKTSMEKGTSSGNAVESSLSSGH